MPGEDDPGEVLNWIHVQPQRGAMQSHSDVQDGEHQGYQPDQSPIKVL